MSNEEKVLEVYSELVSGINGTPSYFIFLLKIGVELMSRLNVLFCWKLKYVHFSPPKLLCGLLPQHYRTRCKPNQCLLGSSLWQALWSARMVGTALGCHKYQEKIVSGKCFVCYDILSSILLHPFACSYGNRQ